MVTIRNTVLIDGRYAVVETEIDTTEIAHAMAARVRVASQRKGRPVAAAALAGAVRARILPPVVTAVRCHNTGDHMCALVDCTRCAPMRAREIYQSEETDALKTFMADGFAQQRHDAAMKQIQGAFESDDERKD